MTQVPTPTPSISGASWALAAEALTMASDQAVSLPTSQQRLRGFVKSYCPFTGFGTVRCGAPGTFGRDCVIDRDEAEKCELSVGAAISFVMRPNDERKIRACDINVLIKGIPQRDFVSKLVEANVDWKKTYTGTIKWFLREKPDAVPLSMQNKDPGYGWIECAETNKMFGYDVWAYPSKLAGLKVGDVVDFKVSIDYYWSWPVASQVRKSKQALPPVSVDEAAEDTEAEVAPRPPGAAFMSIDEVSRAVQEALEDGGICNTKGSEEDAIIAKFTQMPMTDVPTPCRAGVPGDEESLQAGMGADQEPLQCATTKKAALEIVEETDAAPCSESHVESGELSEHLAGCTWQQFKTEDGQGNWWWCESDGDYFMEDSPGPWAKYSDPNTGKHYWWKTSDKWFWA